MQGLYNRWSCSVFGWLCSVPNQDEEYIINNKTLKFLTDRSNIISQCPFISNTLHVRWNISLGNVYYIIHSLCMRWSSTSLELFLIFIGKRCYCCRYNDLVFYKHWLYVNDFTQESVIIERDGIPKLINIPHWCSFKASSNYCPIFIWTYSPLRIVITSLSLWLPSLPNSSV